MTEIHRDWLKEIDGQKKFKREHLLNHAANNWGLNKAFCVGPTSELIRACQPKTLEEWEKFYFENAIQKKKKGLKITREYIEELGRRLYVKLTEVVKMELQSITEEECIDYMFNLVINRTFHGYVNEIDTVYGQLESALGIKIEPASDMFDRSYNVDFIITVNGYSLGLQIKPIGAMSNIPQIYRERGFQLETHRRFAEKFGGRVFYVFSKKKVIQDKEQLVSNIKLEIERLQSLPPPRPESGA